MGNDLIGAARRWQDQSSQPIPFYPILIESFPGFSAGHSSTGLMIPLFRYPSIWCTILTLVAFLGPTVGEAAPVEDEARGTASEQSSAPAPSAINPTPLTSPSQQADTSLQSEFKLIEGPDGKPIPIPIGQYEKFQEWLKTQNKPPQTELAPYYVTQVLLEGHAEEKHAILTAKFTIQVNETGRVKVPLQMREAVLLKEPDHKGPGLAMPDISDRGFGNQWIFEGRGKHELTCEIIVPIRNQSPSRRLQLSLPPTANSYLELKVPLRDLVISQPPESFLEKTPLPDGSTRIVVRGLGTRLNLSWKHLPKPGVEKTVLETATLMAVTLTNQTVLLQAIQEIRALPSQGSFQQIRVQLPAHFTLLNVEELNVDGKQYLSHEVDSQNVAVVEFAEPTVGPVKLRWTLEAPFSAGDRRMVLQGFAVDQARSESGFVAIGAFEGYHLEDLHDADEGIIRRANLRELASFNEFRSLLDPNSVSRVYRFQTQPFRLELRITRIQPYFTVKPHIALHFSERRVQMDAEFQFGVYRGVVSEIQMEWPHWNRWWIESLELVEAPGFVERAPDEEQDTEDRIRLRLAVRQNKKFRIRLKASRPLTTDQEPFELSLPGAIASRQQPIILAVASADNIETDISAQDSTLIRPLSIQDRERVYLPEAWSGLRRKEYRVDSTARIFSAMVTAHDQAIRTESVAEITLDTKSQRLVVDQKIQYDVSWRELSTVQLMVPRELFLESEQKRVIFSLRHAEQRLGERIAADKTGLDVGNRKQIRLTLDPPRIGSFEIHARFSFKLPEKLAAGDADKITIPLIHSSDAAFDASHLKINQTDTLTAAPATASWQPQLTFDDTPLWVATDAKQEIPLQLKHSNTPPNQDFSVSKALIRTALPTHGSPQSRAQYLIDGSVSTLVMALPPDLTIDNVWWNQQKVSFNEVAAPSSDGHQQHRIQIPQDVSGDSHLLTIDFHSTEMTSFASSNSHRLSSPQFPPNVWITQTIWQIILPESQYLFTYPEGFSPLFEWRRQGLFWLRVPYRQYAELDQWISAANGPAPLGIFSQGFSAYPFSHFGPARPMKFWSMNQSLIVLIGTGFALAVGFALVVIPATRHVLSLLAIVCAIALIRLWFAAPTELLLQPAIVGVLSGAAASVIDGRRRRKRESAIFTISTPSDLITPPSTVDPTIGVGTGSEEPTAVRSSPQIVADMYSSSDSEHRK